MEKARPTFGIVPHSLVAFPPFVCDQSCRYGIREDGSSDHRPLSQRRHAPQSIDMCHPCAEGETPVDSLHRVWLDTAWRRQRHSHDRQDAKGSSRSQMHQEAPSRYSPTVVSTPQNRPLGSFQRSSSITQCLMPEELVRVPTEKAGVPPQRADGP